MNDAVLTRRAAVLMPAVSVPTSALTLDGFREWVKSPCFPEKGIQASFLDEEVLIDMAPELYDTHNAAKTAIYGALEPLIRQLGTGELVTDRMLYTNKRAGVSTEPDALFFTYEGWQAGRVRMEPSPTGKPNYELVGTPELVLEVVSDSSEEKDLVRLRRLYHLAGIVEYWVIDARGDDLSFEILRHAAAEYVPVPPTADGWLRSAVFGREFRLTRERSVIGLWRYTLHVRPTSGERGA